MTNQTLTQIQEEFEKNFYPYITNGKGLAAKDFLTQSNLRVIEKVRQMVENNRVSMTELDKDDPDNYGALYARAGCNKVIEDILFELSTLIEQK